VGTATANRFEPDARVVHVRIRGGPGRVTAWGYPTASKKSLPGHPG
jgi:hypothetical protein